MIGAQQTLAQGMGCTSTPRLQVFPEGGLYGLRDVVTHVRHRRRERAVQCAATHDPIPDSTAAVSRRVLAAGLLSLPALVGGAPAGAAPAGEGLLKAFKAQQGLSPPGSSADAPKSPGPAKAVSGSDGASGLPKGTGLLAGVGALLAGATLVQARPKKESLPSNLKSAPARGAAKSGTQGTGTQSIKRGAGARGAAQAPKSPGLLGTLIKRPAEGTGKVRGKPTTGTTSIKRRQPAPAPARGTPKPAGGTDSNDLGSVFGAVSVLGLAVAVGLGLVQTAPSAIKRPSAQSPQPTPSALEFPATVKSQSFESRPAPALSDPPKPSRSSAFDLAEAPAGPPAAPASPETSPDTGGSSIFSFFSKPAPTVPPEPAAPAAPILPVVPPPQERPNPLGELGALLTPSKESNPVGTLGDQKASAPKEAPNPISDLAELPPPAPVKEKDSAANRMSSQGEDTAGKPSVPPAVPSPMEPLRGGPAGVPEVLLPANPIASLGDAASPKPAPPPASPAPPEKPPVIPFSRLDLPYPSAPPQTLKPNEAKPEPPVPKPEESPAPKAEAPPPTVAPVPPGVPPAVEPPKAPSGPDFNPLESPSPKAGLPLAVPGITPTTPQGPDLLVPPKPSVLPVEPQPAPGGGTTPQTVSGASVGSPLGNGALKVPESSYLVLGLLAAAGIGSAAAAAVRNLGSPPVGSETAAEVTSPGGADFLPPTPVLGETGSSPMEVEARKHEAQRWIGAWRERQATYGGTRGANSARPQPSFFASLWGALTKAGEAKPADTGASGGAANGDQAPSSTAGPGMPGGAAGPAGSGTLETMGSAPAGISSAGVGVPRGPGPGQRPSFFGSLWVSERKSSGDVVDGGGDAGGDTLGTAKGTEGEFGSTPAALTGTLEPNPSASLVSELEVPVPAGPGPQGDAAQTNGGASAAAEPSSPDATTEAAVRGSGPQGTGPTGKRKLVEPLRLPSGEKGVLATPRVYNVQLPAAYADREGRGPGETAVPWGSGVVLGWLNDPIEARPPTDPDPDLINEDLAPTEVAGRSFSTLDFMNLWIGLVISLSTWLLAASLIDMGFSWWQGIASVLLGNVVTLLPVLLNGSASTRWGLPFPVLARASFGIRGANLPALLRGAIACGWFALQTWVGGRAIAQFGYMVTGTSALTDALWFGVPRTEYASFALFWALQVGILVRGMESIRVVERAAAPLLVALSGGLLWWALSTAGGWGPLLTQPSQFGPGMRLHGQFWPAFIRTVTANVGYWATLAVSIGDFTRYARSQRAQAVGQALGLPLFMAAFSFLGLAVTSATIVITGQAIYDPVSVVRLIPGRIPVCLGLFGLLVATLSTNIAANIVAPANALVNVAPRRISFLGGALLTSLPCLFLHPWRLVDTGQGFQQWLMGASVLLGPVGGIMLSDYFLVRQRQLLLDDLYSSDPQAAYWYQGGWNPAALVALAVGIAPSLPGFAGAVGLTQPAAPIFVFLYSFSWFISFFASGLLYWALMSRRGRPAAPPVAAPAM
eukprot:jgi/Botrbrau1/7818/Bobra.0159s0246.1